MRPVTIEAKTLPEAWFFCMRALLDRKGLSTGSEHRMQEYGVHEYTITRGSFEQQQRLEFDHVTVYVEYPGSRPLVPDTPQGIPVPTTQEKVEMYMPYIMTDVKAPNETYTYGQDLAPQIPKVIKMYKDSGAGTNQAYMAVGDKNSIDIDHPQCLRGIDTRILDNKLHFVVYFRSWDLWGGFSENLAGIQILKEYMASEIGVGDGVLIANSKGLHLYDYSWPLAKAVVNR